MREPTARTRRPGLVARAAELRELDRALTRCAAGGFGCVLLVGDAGAGKSRLAAEFVARLSGTTVLAARAYHLGATASFGVWAEALDRELRTRTPEQVRRLCGATVADLAGLLYGVAALTAAPPVEPPRTRLSRRWPRCCALSPANGRSWSWSTTCTSPTPRRWRHCTTWPTTAPTSRSW